MKHLVIRSMSHVEQWCFVSRKGIYKPTCVCTQRTSFVDFAAIWGRTQANIWIPSLVCQLVKNEGGVEQVEED